MKEIYRLQPICNNILNILSINDEPPKLVDLMESKVNYDNSNPVDVDKLPEYFRSYMFDFDYPIDSKYKEDFEITFENLKLNSKVLNICFTSKSLNLSLSIIFIILHLYLYLIFLIC